MSYVYDMSAPKKATNLTINNDISKNDIFSDGLRSF